MKLVHWRIVALLILICALPDRIVRSESIPGQGGPPGGSLPVSFPLSTGTCGPECYATLKKLKGLEFPDLGRPLTTIYVSSEAGGDYPLGVDTNDGMSADSPLFSVAAACDRAVPYTRVRFDSADTWDSDAELGPLAVSPVCGLSCVCAINATGCSASNELCIHLTSSSRLSEPYINFSLHTGGVGATVNHWIGVGGEIVSDVGNVVVDNLHITNKQGGSGDVIGVRDAVNLYLVNNTLPSESTFANAQSITSHDTGLIIPINNRFESVAELYRGGHIIAIGNHFKQTPATAAGTTNSMFQGQAGVSGAFPDPAYSVILGNTFDCGDNGINTPAFGVEFNDGENGNTGDFEVTIADNLFTGCADQDVGGNVERSEALRLVHNDSTSNYRIWGNRFHLWQRAIEITGTGSGGRMTVSLLDTHVAKGDGGANNTDQQLFVDDNKCADYLDLTVAGFRADGDDENSIVADYSACLFGGGGTLHQYFSDWRTAMLALVSGGPNTSTMNLDAASSPDIGGEGVEDTCIKDPTPTLDASKECFGATSPAGQHVILPAHFPPGFQFLPNLLGFEFNRIEIGDFDAGTN